MSSKIGNFLLNRCEFGGPSGWNAVATPSQQIEKSIGRV